MVVCNIIIDVRPASYTIYIIYYINERTLYIYTRTIITIFPVFFSLGPPLPTTPAAPVSFALRYIVLLLYKYYLFIYFYSISRSWL